MADGSVLRGLVPWSLLVAFFFSSGRRHTRWPRDWSSDVCSSDLPNSEKDFEFVNDIVGGSIPKEFIKPTEQGIKEAMEKGILAGYPMTGIRVTLYDGRSEERRVGKVWRSRAWRS